MCCPGFIGGGSQALKCDSRIGVALDGCAQGRAVCGTGSRASTGIDSKLLRTAKDVAPEQGGISGAFAVSDIGSGVELVAGELFDDDIDVDVGRSRRGIGVVGVAKVDFDIGVEDAYE